MSRVSLKIITVTLILVALGFGLWLINQNIPYYGTSIVSLDFNQDQPMISRLGPEVRTRIVDQGLAVLESPVYFDLRSLPWFRTAQFYLTFKTEGAALEGMAGQVGPGWQYHPVKPLAVRDLGDGWQKAIFEFDLASLYQQKNVRRFLISTQQEIEGQLVIKDLTVILKQ